MWLAEMDSEHFTWRAVAPTRDEAMAAVARAWDGATDPEREATFSGEVALHYFGAGATEIKIGAGYRDGRLIATAPALDPETLANGSRTAMADALLTMWAIEGAECAHGHGMEACGEAHCAHDDIRPALRAAERCVAEAGHDRDV